MWSPRQETREELLERVLVTCVEMVTDRGYSVLTACATHDPALVAEREGEVLHLLFHPEDKVGVKAVRTLQQEMDASGVGKVLLVSTDGPTPFTKKELSDEERIAFWTIAKLVINITKFDIVPPHTLLGEEEAASLAKQFHVKSDKDWPKLLRSDPVCRYYDFPVGGLVKVDRSFGHAAHVYYRMVT